MFTRRCGSSACLLRSGYVSIDQQHLFAFSSRCSGDRICLVQACPFPGAASVGTLPEDGSASGNNRDSCNTAALDQSHNRSLWDYRNQPTYLLIRGLLHMLNGTIIFRLIFDSTSFSATQLPQGCAQAGHFQSCRRASGIHLRFVVNIVGNLTSSALFMRSAPRAIV